MVFLIAAHILLTVFHTPVKALTVLFLIQVHTALTLFQIAPVQYATVFLILVHIHLIKFQTLVNTRVVLFLIQDHTLLTLFQIAPDQYEIVLQIPCQIDLTKVHIEPNVLTTKPFIAAQPCDNAEPICCPLVMNHCLVAAQAVPKAEVKEVHIAPGLLFIKAPHAFFRLFQKSLPF